MPGVNFVLLLLLLVVVVVVVVVVLLLLSCCCCCYCCCCCCCCCLNIREHKNAYAYNRNSLWFSSYFSNVIISFLTKENETWINETWNMLEIKTIWQDDMTFFHKGTKLFVFIFKCFRQRSHNQLRIYICK